MQIDYEASNFPASAGPALSGKSHITVSWVDLVWAAITYGKPHSSHLLAYRWHSLSELVVRAHSLNMYLLGSPIHVAKSALYSSMDATEKGAASYFLAMTLSKLFAGRLLHTPWLFHVSMATKGGHSLTYSTHSNSRPDLIGLDTSSRWVVMEAKGRSTGFSGEALKNAKNQSQMISTINGDNPLYRIGVEAYFAPVLKAKLVDPDANKDAYAIEVNVESAISAYYSIVRAVAASGEERTIDDERYVVRFDSDSGLTMGVPKHFSGLKTWSNVPKELNRSRRSITPSSAIYEDGIYLALDSRWNPENMNKDPSIRTL